MSEVPKFKTLGEFIAFAGDGEKNGTGAPRTHFNVHVVEEPIPGTAETINVLVVQPHGFEYMGQRFALHADDGNKLLDHEQIDAFKTFKRNEAEARREQQRVAADAARNGVVSARIGDANGGGQ